MDFLFRLRVPGLWALHVLKWHNPMIQVTSLRRIPFVTGTSLSIIGNLLDIFWCVRSTKSSCCMTRGGAGLLVPSPPRSWQRQGGTSLGVPTDRLQAGKPLKEDNTYDANIIQQLSISPTVLPHLECGNQILHCNVPGRNLWRKFHLHIEDSGMFVCWG